MMDHDGIAPTAGRQAHPARLDWLADPANRVGNVQLPTECVLAHPESMRAAIDMAMRMGTDATHNDPHGPTAAVARPAGTVIGGNWTS